MDRRARLKAISNLDKEIEELDSFIYIASRVWSGKLTLKKLLSLPYGMFSSRELYLNTELKNKILTVIEEYRDDKAKQMDSLMK